MIAIEPDLNHIIFALDHTSPGPEIFAGPYAATVWPCFAWSWSSSNSQLPHPEGENLLKGHVQNEANDAWLNETKCQTNSNPGLQVDSFLSLQISGLCKWPWKKSADVLRFAQVKKTSPPVTQRSHGRHCDVGLFWLGAESSDRVSSLMPGIPGNLPVVESNPFQKGSENSKQGSRKEVNQLNLCCNCCVVVRVCESNHLPESTSYPDQRFESHLKSLLGH